MRKIDYCGVPTGPEIEEYFMVQVPCYKCGTITAIQIDKDDSFDRSEAEHWEGRYRDLLGSVNTLISDTEHRTGYNPQKEAFLAKLVDIRNRLASD